MSDYMSCANINDFFDKTDNDVLTVMVDGKNRTFCKCGAVSATRNYKCPVCGNEKMAWTSVNSYGTGTREIYTETEMVRQPDGFELLLHKYGIIENTSGELEYSLFETQTIAVKNSEGLTFSFSDWYRIANYFQDIKCLDMEYIKRNDGTFFTEYSKFNFDSFWNTNKFLNSNLNLDNVNYFLYCYLKAGVPWFFNKTTIENMPSALLGAHLKDISKLSGVKNFSEYIRKWEMKSFQEFLKFPWFYGSYQGFPRDIFDININRMYEALPDSYRDLIKYYTEHYKFSYSQMSLIIQSLTIAINKLYIDEKVDDIFIRYLKDNLISSKEKIIEDYLKDLEWLAKLSLTRTNENIRNINFLRNAELIKEVGFPEQKVGVFMDSFYDNPLKASMYLKSKKDLTKKELEEFIEKQTK